ncbi:MAG: hypothetical protein KDH09_00930, partial [Chrysiogenetes bacterium]|nr:hypothetical protein [Chrysiogenetes bacterium]
HWMRRMVWLAHPEGVRLPAYESVIKLTIKILLVVSAFSLPLFVATLYTFNVTTGDLMRAGLEGMPDFILGYVIAFFILGVGYFVYERFFRKRGEVVPAPDDVAHLHELSDLVNTMPLRSAITSMVLWGGAGMLTGWGVGFLLDFSATFAIWTVMALSVIGVVSFPFQYFLFQRIFEPLGNKLKDAAGEGYRVENAGIAALSIEDEQAVRDRLITGVRVALAAPVWGAFALVHDKVEFFYVGILIAYTVISISGYIATYGSNIRRAAEYLRWAADGVGLVLFVQYSGSMTTIAVGLYWVIIYTITLQRGFDTGLVFTTFYSALYGSVLFSEYVGWLPHAPATSVEGELLDVILYRSPWNNFHPSVAFLASFIFIAGGMVACVFMAHVYRRRNDSGIRGLLDLD